MLTFLQKKKKTMGYLVECKVGKLFSTPKLQKQLSPYLPTVPKVSDKWLDGWYPETKFKCATYL